MSLDYTKAKNQSINQLVDSDILIFPFGLASSNDYCDESSHMTPNFDDYNFPMIIENVDSHGSPAEYSQNSQGDELVNRIVDNIC